METGHWITIIGFFVGGLLSIGQAVFWFEIRNLHATDRDLAQLIQEVQKRLMTCRADHDSTSATRNDIARLEASIAALHKRLDSLFQFLAERRP
jgi:cob(I)alamin adenosyltransferase